MRSARCEEIARVEEPGSARDPPARAPVQPAGHFRQRRDPVAVEVERLEAGEEFAGGAAGKEPLLARAEGAPDVLILVGVTRYTISSPTGWARPA